MEKDQLTIPKGYARDLWWHAWDDSREAAFGSATRTLITAALSAGAAFVYPIWQEKGWEKGWQVVKDAIWNNWALALPVFIPFGIWFLINLLLLTPRRLVAREHSARLKLNEELSEALSKNAKLQFALDNQLPKLKGRNLMAIYPPPLVPYRGVTEIFIFIEIENGGGRPTIIKDFELIATIGDQVFEGKKCRIPEGTKLYIKGSGTLVEPEPLYRFYSEVIGLGERKGGAALFAFDAPEGEINRPDAVFEFICKDINNNECKIPFTVDGQPSDPLFHPGVVAPIRPNRPPEIPMSTLLFQGAEFMLPSPTQHMEEPPP